MTSNQSARDIVEDFKALAEMIDSASKRNLVAEVVWSFGNDRAGGSTTLEAIQFALSEWDL